MNETTNQIHFYTDTQTVRSPLGSAVFYQTQYWDPNLSCSVKPSGSIKTFVNKSDSWFWIKPIWNWVLFGSDRINGKPGVRFTTVPQTSVGCAVVRAYDMKTLRKGIGRPMAPAGLSQRRPWETMWDLWGTKWHWDGALSKYFCFTLSVSFHQSPVSIYYRRHEILVTVGFVNSRTQENCNHKFYAVCKRTSTFHVCRQQQNQIPGSVIFCIYFPNFSLIVTISV
jgi:hypothetical protein